MKALDLGCAMDVGEGFYKVLSTTSGGVQVESSPRQLDMLRAAFEMREGAA